MFGIGDIVKLEVNNKEELGTVVEHVTTSKVLVEYQARNGRTRQEYRDITELQPC